MSRRPQFAAEFRRWMGSRGVSSYQRIADDLKAAGHPDKIYRSKVSGFVHRNEGVPSSFFGGWTRQTAWVTSGLGALPRRSWQTLCGDLIETEGRRIRQ